MGGSGTAIATIFQRSALADLWTDALSWHRPEPATAHVDLLAHDRLGLVAPAGPTETWATVQVRRGE